MSGKTQGIWKFCQNTGKAQGILFAQVVNSLILKVNICRENFLFFQIFNRSAKSVLSIVCNSHKLCKLAQGKFAIGLGKHREFENTI